MNPFPRNGNRVMGQEAIETFLIWIDLTTLTHHPFSCQKDAVNKENRLRRNFWAQKPCSKQDRDGMHWVKFKTRNTSILRMHQQILHGITLVRTLEGRTEKLKEIHPKRHLKSPAILDFFKGNVWPVYT